MMLKRQEIRACNHALCNTKYNVTLYSFEGFFLKNKE